MPHRAAAPLERIDPRSRLIAALVFALFVAVSVRWPTLLAALAAACLCAGLSGLPLRTIARRLAPLNIFMLFLVALMPVMSTGRVIGSLGPIHYGEDGLWLALAIAARGNAIVLMLIALLGSLDVTTLGHALNHLRMPAKLTHLLLFTVRYLGVLRTECQRLQAAMRLRAFQPAANRHTLQTYGHLIGMLLVRSLDRSERVVAAMKCRGFQGHFYLLDHFHCSRRDVWFGLTSMVALAGLVFLEWV
jgi:cobalt/nickel transport system permease protein